MPVEQLAVRNVFIVDASGETVAGCHQFGSISFQLLFSWLRICFAQPSSFLLANETGIIFAETSSILVAEGWYTVLGADDQPCRVQLSAETVRVRNLEDVPPTTRHCNPQFRSRVQERDAQCIATGRPGIRMTGLKVAYIVAKAHIDYWEQANLQRYIIDQHPNQGRSKICSVQNGILLRKNLQQFWDTYGLTINPMTMRLQVFDDNMMEYDQVRTLIGHSEELPSPPQELLMDHYRQAVLANVRGSGEVQLLDFDPQSDVGEACESGEGKLWFENHLMERLT